MSDLKTDRPKLILIFFRCLAFMHPHPLEDAYFSGKRLKRQCRIHARPMNTGEWFKQGQDKAPKSD
ncbi:MAG: hypothetical protein B6D78_05970 [gamma proteobacterium symbiont of Ctena orbiculata]|nr:MAG: hypothetical protein B6D78_05970 [gamma proteobacterium symbiont of Ctena orbiculata]